MYYPVGATRSSKKKTSNPETHPGKPTGLKVFHWGYLNGEGRRVRGSRDVHVEGGVPGSYGARMRARSLKKEKHIKERRIGVRNPCER